MTRTTRMPALVALGRALAAEGYSFVTPSPETHRRVNARAARAGRAMARDVRDVFGWSRPFERDVLAPHLFDLAATAGVVADAGDGALRATVRWSSLRGRLFLHSAYPTLAEDCVFFGPDTYRYCDLVEDVLARDRERRGARAPLRQRVVDVGSGSGAGGIVAAPFADAVVLADVNPAALASSAVGAELAGVRAEIVESDALAGVRGPIDVVLANPPYMADPAKRTYRDGGGAYGEALAVRIAREALGRLEPGGLLVLYTGASIVAGVDTFRAAVADVCDRSGARWSYREIDPDVFGDEIENNDLYADVERIAAVALVAEVAR